MIIRQNMKNINLLKPRRPADQSAKFQPVFRISWRIAKSLLFGVGVGISLIIFVALCSAAIYGYLYKSVSPDVNKLLAYQPPETTKIFDRNGGLLYQVYSVKRTVVPLSQISADLKHATIAIEDKDFYSHQGISLKSLFRSMVVDYYLKDASFGGSTITQQLVKNVLLTNQKTFSRKFAEIIWAMEIERSLDKSKILELYLNQIYYGRNAYGIETASQTYFNKPAKDLNLAESAYLAALTKAPSLYDPGSGNAEALKKRQVYILNLMRQQGYINGDQEQKALATQIEVKPLIGTFKAPHFVLWVKQLLIKKYGAEMVEQGGLKVYTTLDPRLQQIAEDTIKTGVEKNIKLYNGHNAGLVAIDPKTGQILAMVGSKDYFGAPEPAGCIPGKNCLFEGNMNVAISERQPGSSFKPYVYATAFSPAFGYTPSSPILDTITNFSGYVPLNYTGAAYGKVTMRKALAGSLNISAVKTAALVGINNVAKTASSLGITSPLENCGLTMALGGCEVTLLDHVAGFSSIANLGKKNPSTAILEIQDKQGKKIEEFSAKNDQVLNPQAAYELISIMTDNKSRAYIFGKKTPLTLSGRTVAAKTGTTDNWHDAWTLGFTPSLTAGVWVGNNDGTLLKANSDGVVVAAPIWNAFMEQALEGTPPEEFNIPKGITKLPFNPITGKPLEKNKTDSAYTDIFADYALPKPKIVLPKIPILKELASALITPNPVTQKQTVGLAFEKAITTASSSGDFLPIVVIMSPKSNSLITKLPFEVKVDVSNKSASTTVDLFMDGRLITKMRSPQFTYTMPELFSPLGSHILVARAYNQEAKYGNSDSVTINIYPHDEGLTSESDVFQGLPMSDDAEQ